MSHAPIPSGGRSPRDSAVWRAGALRRHDAHDVLSVILRSAVKWGHLQANPAQRVEMPRLKTIRPKWALTLDRATALAAKLPWLLPRTLVGLALLTGLRRGELFALRWWDIDEPNRSLQVRAAVYEGVFDDPKTMGECADHPGV